MIEDGLSSITLSSNLPFRCRLMSEIAIANVAKYRDKTARS